ncbi:MAG: DUF4198 domain-containing protein [Rhodospirillales bacterium]|nr:DUF4198 domain-containing protein [Rhodospirillales bacterium]
MRRLASAVAAVLAFSAAPAWAHFQLVYTPVVNLENPETLPFKLVFTHPFENGHAMDMGKPESFSYSFKGERTDLTNALKPITWHGASNASKAFEAEVKIQRNGDYIFVLVPEPYFEGSEGIYIQQITKSFVNKGGVPTGWEQPVGLPTEIVPLNKPYNLLTGSTFSGVLLSDGKPAAGVEIEIEYMAALPDMKANKPGEVTAQPASSALVAITDERGVFTFGIPKAGFWGFAALGSGPVKEHKGKELSQDAVIWIYAEDMK